MRALYWACTAVLASVAFLALAGAWHHIYAGNIPTSMLLAALGGEHVMLSIAAWQERPKKEC